MKTKTYGDMRSNWEFGEASECRKGLMCGMGYTVEEQKRPLIGVVNSWNEYNPGHVHLDKLAEQYQHMRETLEGLKDKQEALKEEVSQKADYADRIETLKQKLEKLDKKLGVTAK